MSRKIETRPYALVESHPWAHKFMARRRQWDWHAAGEIDVLDADGHVTDVLKDWQTAIFHAADGNQTLQEFVSAMADQYRDQTAIPADLAQILLEQVRSLVEDSRVIELWDRPDDLQDSFDLPRPEGH